MALNQRIIGSPIGGIQAPTQPARSSQPAQGPTQFAPTNYSTTPTGIPNQNIISTPVGGISQPTQPQVQRPDWYGSGDLLKLVPQPTEFNIDQTQAPGNTNTPSNTTGTAGVTGGSSVDAASRNLIEGQYSDLLGQLNKGVGNAKGAAQRAQDQLARRLSNQKGILRSSFEQGQENIGFEREKLQRDKARNLTDLAQNLRSAYQAGTIQLGNLGAGDSSATGQLSVALQQEGNRNRQDILEQVFEQDQALGQALKNLENEFETQKSQLLDFAQQEKFNIQETLRSQLQAIQEEKFNASQARQSALESLETRLIGEAQAQANKLDAQINTAFDQIDFGKVQAQTQAIEQLAGASANPINANTGFSPISSNNPLLTDRQFPAPVRDDEEEF